MKHKSRLLIPIFLILAGIFLILSSTLRNVPVAEKGDKQEVQEKNSKPVKLYVPKIDKVLSVSDGAVLDNRWVISQTGVSYLTTSAQIGSTGNSVLYGHNLTPILGRLKEVSTGDLIYVVADTGSFYKYKVVETKIVKPTDVYILNNTNDSRLTIYTCDGFLDQARFVAIATLQMD